jgi:hypothetical protein
MASLAMLAVFQIPVNYVKIITSTSIRAPVRELARSLLKDFDERYHPVDSLSGKVCYSGMADIGFRNRYTGVYPYFIIAMFLDPGTKSMFVQKLMDEKQSEQLNKDVLVFMVEEKKQAHAHEGGDFVVVAAATLVPTSAARQPEGEDGNDSMFGDLENVEHFVIQTTPDEDNLLKQCQVEMEAYLADKGLPLRKDNKKMYCDDPLL